MSDQQQQRLDRLGERIDEARRDAQDHGTLTDPDEPTLLDPDADGDEDEFRVQPPL
jgi:hypothetical protein